MPNSDYQNLHHMYGGVITQYRHYLKHVLMNIGHMYITPQTVEQGGAFFSFPSKQKIRSAVQFFNEQLFKTPYWLESKKLYLKGTGAGVVQTYKLQEAVLHELVNPSTWNWLLFNETNQSKEQSYNYDELLTDVECGIWAELNKHENIEMGRRNVQKVYVAKLIDGLRNSRSGDLGLLDCSTIILDHIDRLYTKICVVLPMYKDRTSKLHLEDLKNRLKVCLDIQKGKLQDMPGKISNRALNSYHALQSTDLYNGHSVPSPEKPKQSCWVTDEPGDGINKSQ
jgi:hypothetical protein